jgi:hypothetical protein
MLPVEKRNRSLEFLASMGSLAQRQGLRALILENIHRSFKRRLPDRVTALSRVASRTGLDQREIDQLLLRDESSANGSPMSDHELIDWVKRIREVEARMGRMR